MRPYGGGGLRASPGIEQVQQSDLDPAGPVVAEAPAAANQRLTVPVRFALIAGVAVGVAGAVGRGVGWPAITATLGPTAYLFAAHPHSESARWWNALRGHTVAVAAGLASLAIFGLWNHGPNFGAPTGLEIGSAVVAVALTMATLEVTHSHHAPAGATSLLVATGLASPGRPLYGLLAGLGVVLVLGPTLGRLIPFGRRVDRQT